MKAKSVIIGGVVAVVLLGSAGALAYGLSRPKNPIIYVTAEVQLADIQSDVMATGTLQPSNVVDVAAQTSGQIQELSVKLGDHVTKGQKIGQIDSTLLMNNVKSTENMVGIYTSSRASMRAALDVQQKEVDRQHAMLAKDMASQSVVEKAEAQLKAITAQVASTETNYNNQVLALDAAKANLEKANIRSPIDGVIAEVVTNEGSTVNVTNSVAIIVRVANMDQMTIKAQVSEADVMKVSTGQEVYFTVLGDPYTRYSGKLRAVEFTPSTGTIDPSKGAVVKQAIYYNALFDVANAKGNLRPGMTANVHVVMGVAKQVPTVPAAALGKQISKNRYVVRVQDANGQVRDRQVTTGLSDELSVEVKDGLKVGDKVVIGEANRQGGAASGSASSLFSLPASLRS